MHTGGQNPLHTPFPDRWGFEPSIDYQSLPWQKSGVFTDVYKFAQSKKSGAIFAAGGANKLFFSIILIELFKDICTIVISNWSLLIGI